MHSKDLNRDVEWIYGLGVILDFHMLEQNFKILTISYSKGMESTRL